LEHPAATSLLPLARISKSFLLSITRPNTPVGGSNVNNSNSIKRATRLSPENQVTLGGYYGGHPPPKKWSHFFAKNSRALSMARPWPRAKFEQGADGLAERTRESEIAYASTRIRPFSLASGPAGCSRKSNFPNSNLLRKRKKQNKCNKVKNTVFLSQVFETK
jgi:hypothetical protein